jgi:hypothetical protein
MLVALGLAKEEEVLAELVFGQLRRIALEVLGELAEITHILLASGWPVIFEIDVLLELRNRTIVEFDHIAARMPSSEGVRTAKITMTTGVDFSCRGAARFNTTLEPTRTGALGSSRVSGLGCVFSARGSALERSTS